MTHAAPVPPLKPTLGKPPEWVDCPICGESDMRKSSDGEKFIIHCVNGNCASNGGTMVHALQTSAQPSDDIRRALADLNDWYKPSRPEYLETIRAALSAPQRVCVQQKPDGDTQEGLCKTDHTQKPVDEKHIYDELKMLRRKYHDDTDTLVEALRNCVNSLQGYRQNHDDDMPCDAEKAGRLLLAAHATGEVA